MLEGLVASIASVVNGVHFEFKGGVNNDVDPKLIGALARIVRPGVPSIHLVSTLFVSSANDSHSWPSRHVQQKAVDISRINGRPIKGNYGVDPAITDIVQRIQREFESVPGRRENFGPYIKRKSGQPYTVGGHDDHIHLSID